jgi:predicted NBD/HSP70 family sugar kinase
LLLEYGQLSRADLARLTSLNKPTISNLVAKLIDDGLVRERGEGVSTGGRKPILLEIQAESRLAAGVEIDASGFHVLIASVTGERLASDIVPLDSTEPSAVADALAAALAALIAGQSGAQLLGCGVAVPGLVNRLNDTVDLPEPFAWEDVPLRHLLEERLGAPVMLTDRGKAAGLGEMWVLGKDQARDLIYLYLGGGVGGAVVIGQRIHLGVRNIAGEIGHMVIDPAGPTCSCGRKGCLEALVSTGAIISRYREIAGNRSDVSPWPIGFGKNAAIAWIGDAAAGGDPVALEVIATTARWIGIAMANLVNVLNPSAVVLGGPTTVWGAAFLRQIEREINQSALPPARDAVTIVIGEAGELAAPLGASALVLQRAPELLVRPKNHRPFAFRQEVTDSIDRVRPR